MLETNELEKLLEECGVSFRAIDFLHSGSALKSITQRNESLIDS